MLESLLHYEAAAREGQRHVRLQASMMPPLSIEPSISAFGLRSRYSGVEKPLRSIEGVRRIQSKAITIRNCEADFEGVPSRNPPFPN